MKKSVISLIGLMSLFNTIAAQAEVASVAYRCPTLKEISPFEVRTSLNEKTVRWAVQSNHNASDDPTEFIGVILERVGSDTFDKHVSCIYRTKKNMKYILNPIKSFNWYVDGAAEKPLGKYWTLAANGTLECRNTPQNCMFMFR